MKKCTAKCIELQTDCPNDDCRYWVKHEASLNCSFIAIEKNGNMDLRSIGDIIGVSFVRVKQIQDNALVKISKSLTILQ